MSNTRGLGRVYRRGIVWWIQYSFRGRKYRESSRSANRSDAVKLLRRRLEEMGAGRLVGPDAERVSFDDLVEMLRADYQVNGRRSWRRAEPALTHLRCTFGTVRAAELTADRLVAYQRLRMDESAAPATIRYELALLKHMFNLAVGAGLLVSRPKFPSITADNRRTGFFEEGDFRAVLSQLPDDLQPVFEFAYYTGWRVPSEVLPLTWRQVDFTAGVIRIERSKNGEARTFPFAALPALAALLRRQREAATALERETCHHVSHVFHRDGKPIRSYRRAWISACGRADCAGMIAHDLRRTAVRNLVRAGVPEAIAMKLTGHKTRSVFDRYNIVDEADLAEGVAKLAALHAYRRSGTIGAQSAGVETPEPVSPRQPNSSRERRIRRVARGRIELPTRGFSVRCSTN
jgi:integrase